MCRCSAIAFQGGKSGIEHQITVKDRRLARIIKGCRKSPQDLFQYLDVKTATAHRILLRQRLPA